MSSTKSFYIRKFKLPKLGFDQLVSTKSISTQLMSASLIALSLLPLSVFAQNVNDQNYLLSNKNYTDNLINFLSTEETNNIKLSALKDVEKKSNTKLINSERQLKNLKDSITSEEARLISLENKLKNKPQLENQLNSEQQQNQLQKSNLDNQLALTSNDLQDLNFKVSSLERERSLLESRLNTQVQLFRLSEQTVNSLEREIDDNKRDIQQNYRQINNLRNDIERLRLEREATQDPSEKQRLQQQIANIRDRIQNLESESRLKDSQVSVNEIRLVSENSQKRQIENTVRSINIELQGNSDQLNSQKRLQRQVEDQANIIKNQIAKLLSRNKDINSELNLLANLPSSIANSKNSISNLKVTLPPLEVAVLNDKNNLTSATDKVVNFQKILNDEKLNLLNSENVQTQELNALLLELQRNVNSTPVVPFSSLGLENNLNIEPLAQSRDWSIYKSNITTLSNSRICAASTRTLDKVTGTVSELFVLKLINADGSYSSPIVLVTHSSTSNPVYSGELKTDRAKPLVMALFQSSIQGEVSLVSKYSDISGIISSLKAHNVTTVKFTIPSSNQTLQFSLRGSNAAISEMLNRCKN